ncbi:conserved hypothetical protein [Leishmania mexicana MHOM/GT/2001/U1103]|uniref:Uncharacterized protein n=1 Tax=Leishmania mexicana (strain MHOM/GT/2001/U1103) TaxID=929439 RepID=E9B0A7_LEIMU|nr:conserved hypothetical protein [Leishmania mexicana MHOM/GT/2001/U1103]CBZ28659.1 conserved hypothetical protein [Leishmania mexicana MHOM/GT/2001/U1103]
MEVRTTRRRVNRAVAAVQSATTPVVSASPLITLTGSAAGRRKSCVTRFASFDALCRAQQKPDIHALLRKELEAKLPRPSPRNDVVAVGGAAIELVLQFLGPVSRNAAAFAQTCRSVRRALFHVMSLEVTVVTPAMVVASALSRETVRRALVTFAAARSAQVRTLVLHEDGLNAVKRECDDGTPIAGLTLPAPWLLQLISQLPYLTELDVRHVQFTEAHHSQALHYLLSDLHLAAAGTLCTLKMDAELMRYWAPGWWRRLINLSSLVVGSRYCLPEPTPDTTASAISPSSLELPADYFTLMCEEGRGWKLSLWVPLQVASLKRILMPASGIIYAGVAELLVNMRCNERTCEWPDAVGGHTPPLPSPAAATASGTASELSPETRNSGASCKAGTGAAAGTESGEVYIYPALTTMTVVDVQERPEVAAEVYQAMLDMAPALAHFNVHDTVSAGTASEAPKKRHGKG